MWEIWVEKGFDFWASNSLTGNRWGVVHFQKSALEIEFGVSYRMHL